MAICDVEKAICHGKRILKQYQHSGAARVPELHEAATRYAIIDPILRSLGWELEYPNQCLVEEWQTLKGHQRVADYILLNRDGKHVALIEAKGFAITKLNRWTEENQLRQLAMASCARIGVLTNGRSWYFYPAPWEESFGKSRGPDTDICGHPGPESARMLHRYLDKRKLWQPVQ